MQWVSAFEVKAVPVGGARVFKRGRDQVVVFRLDDGALYAVDNRCPHEGYPLVQGALRGCVLTCSFHNFKFDLRDGACVMGDEDVRTYPLRVVDGRIEVDLTPPDPAVLRPRLWASLERGSVDGKLGQVARDVVRLLETGVDPAQIALFGARYDAARGEYGCGHALPVAADVLRWLGRYRGAQAAIPLLQALDVAIEPNRRRPVRSVPEAVPAGDPATFSARLGQAVEAEQAEPAQALLRGGLALGREVVEPAMLGLCADHFLDYGHGLIFTIKAFDLLEAVGWERADEVLPGLVFGIVTGTREDMLPAWRSWRRRVAALDLDALAGGDGPAAVTLSATVVDGTEAEALEAVVQALAEGASVHAVADALCLAAAERLLRFDDRIDRDLGNQNGWLDATHVHTFCNAVHHALGRWSAPRAVALLLQATRMVAMTRVLDRPASERVDTTPEPGDALAAIAARRPEAAVRRAAWALRQAPEALLDGLWQAAVTDPAVRPIVVAHAMKQTVAAVDDSARTGSPLPVLALVRLLASPIAERRVLRTTHEAIAFVTEGRVPRTLIS